MGKESASRSGALLMYALVGKESVSLLMYALGCRFWYDAPGVEAESVSRSGALLMYALVRRFGYDAAGVEVG